MHSKKLDDIPLWQIVPNRFQPRIHFDDAKIESLAKSIMTYGVLEPIIVRPLGEKYEIIAGERRFKASKLANKSTIPAIIVDFDDKESIELALLENIQRQELTAIEEAIAYRRILDMGQITQEELAKKTGKSQPTIANKMRLLALDDETQDALINHKISERHARSLLKLVGTGKELKMLERIISERLTVRDTDREISKLLEKNETKENEIINDFFVKSAEQLENKETVYDDIELQIAKIEEAIEQMKEEKGENKFMDIEKIMQEAQDINISEEPKDLNKFVTTPSPYDTIFGNNEHQTAQEVNDITGILANDIPEEQNKFINIIKPEETEEKNSEPLHPTVTFDNVFNTTFETPESKEENVMDSEAPELSLAEEYANSLEINNDSVEKSNIEINSTIPTDVNSLNLEQDNVEKLVGTFPESIDIDAVNMHETEIPEFTSTIAESSPSFENNNSEYFLNDNSIEMAQHQDAEIPLEQKTIEPITSSFNTIESLDFPETLEKNESDFVSEQSAEKDFSKVLDIINECSEKIKELGYEINTNEFDLSNLYQVTIIINK